MGVIINELVGANANANADADANDWVTTLVLLYFIRRAKKSDPASHYDSRCHTVVLSLKLISKEIMCMHKTGLEARGLLHGHL